MQLRDFIFSENSKYRILRHLSFWLTWIVFSAAVQITPFFPDTVSLKYAMIYYILKAFIRIPFQVLFCYYVVYFLIHKFILKKKYWQFVLNLLLAAFILFWLTYFFLAPGFNFLTIRIFKKPLTLFVKLFYSFYSNINFTGAVPACCFMLVIKYYKNWYTKQRESQALVSENAKAELQLLKAQVHPHFLFNTLNNIYSYTITQHPFAANLVDKLSGMIDYMRIEGSKLLVELEKEIQLLNDYIELEKVRYGSRLRIKVNVEGHLEDKLIAPLLLIPFVENAFKHGASKTRGNQWIDIQARMNDNKLDFYVANSKPEETKTTDIKNGIGLSNVQKRLQLLYPGNHIIHLISSNTTYSVHLQIPLSEVTKETAFINSQLAVYV
jgi:sensor histidine kinase YesM